GILKSREALSAIQRLFFVAAPVGKPFAAAGAVRIAFEAGDEVLQAVRLTGKLLRPLALGSQPGFDLRLLALTLLGEQRQAGALLGQRLDLAIETFAFLGDALAQARELAEVGPQDLGVAPHFRQNCPEQHGGAQRLQSVFRPDQHDRRRLAPNALKCRQHLHDNAALGFKRLAHRLLAAVERRKPLHGGGDLSLGAAHAACRLDQLRGKLAPVVADRFDFALQLRLALERAPLLGAEDGELLLALLERLGRSRAAGVRDAWWPDVERRRCRRRIGGPVRPAPLPRAGSGG